MIRGSGKFTINDVKNYAQKKGGFCLSENYKKTIDQLKWRCGLGHEWVACFHEMKRRKESWCPVCAHIQHRVYSIEDCNEFAKNFFGKCLSDEFIHTKKKLTWQCELGHTWQATFGNIKDNGSWCPECSQSYGERKFRETIEKITGYKFPKIRPNWLKNEFGNRMEIDGFCLKLKTGFEYQGRQHLEFIPHWHKNIEKYEKQKSDDDLKNRLLREQGIYMIYPTCKLKPIEFKDFIVSELSKFNLKLVL